MAGKTTPRASSLSCRKEKCPPGGKGSPSISPSMSPPRYGILKEFRLFTEMPHDGPFTEPTRPKRRAVDRTERMVQIPLPFL
jgi:hypothetical protein